MASQGQVHHNGPYTPGYSKKGAQQEISFFFAAYCKLQKELARPDQVTEGLQHEAAKL